MARKKVLIVEDEQGIRSRLHTLLESMGCDSTSVPGAKPALDLLRRKTYDAIVLDAQCSNDAANEIVSGILETEPNLMSKVLVINGGLADPKMAQAVESHHCPKVSRDHIMRDLWDNLQYVFRRNLPRRAA